MGNSKQKTATIEFDFNAEEQHSHEEEAATVVIDFNSVKNKETPPEQENIGEIDLQFQAHSTAPGIDARKVREDELESLISDEDEGIDLGLDEDFDLSMPPLSPPSQKLFLFDIQGTHLAQLYGQQDTPGYETEVLTSLSQLNQKLKETGDCCLVFFYNQAPKAVNKLLAQIKNKFPAVKTMIIAKNLSPEKAAHHQQTASGAKVYLNEPSQFSEVLEKLDTLS